MPGTTRRGFYQLLGKETTSEEETDESINLEEELQYDNDKKTRLLQRVGKSLAIMLISLAALMVYTWAIYLAVTNGEMKRCTRRLAPWSLYPFPSRKIPGLFFINVISSSGP